MEGAEAGMMPDEKVITEMGRFKEELVKASVRIKPIVGMGPVDSLMNAMTFGQNRREGH